MSPYTSQASVDSGGEREREEDDGDDDPVVFYRESRPSEPRPSWALSQGSVPFGTDAGGTTGKPGEAPLFGDHARISIHDRQSPEKGQAAAAASLLAARKRQRKSSGRRLAGSRGSDAREHGWHDGGNSEDDNDDDDDGFASLRSIVGRQELRRDDESSESSSNNNNHHNDNSKGNGNDRRVRAGTEATGVPLSSDDSWRESAGQNPQRDDFQEPLCSPPEFDLCVSNNYNDDEENNNEDHNNNNNITNKDGPDEFDNSLNPIATKVSSLAGRMGRHSGSETYGHRKSVPGKKANPNPNLNRKRKRSDPMRREGLGVPLPRNRRRDERTKQDRHQNRTQGESRAERETNVQTVKSKSIVGLRPTHWARSRDRDRGSVHRGDNIGGKAPGSTQQLATASALAAATRTRAPFRGLSKNRRGTKGGTDAPTRSRTPEDLPAAHGSGSTDKTPTKPSSFSFAPSFARTKNRVLAEDAIGDDSDSDAPGKGRKVVAAAAARNPSNASPVAPGRRRSSGGWVRALAALRRAREADLARLRNPPVGRPAFLPARDPRKNAGTVTDATVLGGFGDNNNNNININNNNDDDDGDLPEDAKVTVLGCVHRHGPGRQASGEAAFLAWLDFSLATARSVGLEPHRRLRIYNAVVLPCRHPAFVDLPPSSIACLNENTQDGEGFPGDPGGARIRCEKTVLCTQLCERID